MIRIVTVVLLVTLFLPPSAAVSGEWYCENPTGVISGASDGIDNCFYRGLEWDGEKPAGELYATALTVIFRRFKCPCALKQPGPHDVQTWQALVDNLPRLYADYPEIRTLARQGLMSSYAFVSDEGRQNFSPLFAGTGDEQLWAILSETASGSKESMAKAFYQWCDKHAMIIEYLSFGGPPSLDEITAGREHPKLEDFGGSISCLKAQSYIYEQLEKLIAEGQPVTRAQAELLTGPLLDRLRNTVYARHGRVFERVDLQNWFSQRKWYKPDPDFDPSALTATDRQNIKTIREAKQQRD